MTIIGILINERHGNIPNMNNSNRHHLTCVLIVVVALLKPAEGKDFSAIDKLLTDSSLIMGGGCALMILTADTVLHKKGYGTFASNPDTVVSIASATKWISAAVLGSIIEDGLLSLDDTIGRYLPLMSAHNKGRITIRQCFSHTAGMKAFTTYLHDPSQTLEKVTDSIALENLYIGALPIGTKFFYGGLSMQVAGRVAEIIDGNPWDSVFAQRIGTPLGMSRTEYFAFNTTPPLGETDNPTIGGGIRTTLSDCGAFVNMLLNKGTYNGEQILAPNIIEMMEQDQVDNAQILYSPYQGFEALDAKLGLSGYGFGVWRAQTEAFPEIEYVSHGATGFAFWVNRTQGYGVVLSVENHFKPLMGTFLTARKLIRDAMLATATTQQRSSNLTASTVSQNHFPPGYYTLLGEKIDIRPFSGRASFKKVLSR